MGCTRRQFLPALAGAAAASAAKYSPKLAVQFYVWTQQFQRERKTLVEGIPEALAATRRAGFERVELMAQFFQGEARAATLAGLKEHGLAMPICYNGGPMHEPAAAAKTVSETLALADVVKPTGCRILNVNPNPKPKRERKTDEELAVQARFVNQLDKELHNRGMRLILHHHDPEMAENAREWRHLLEHTRVGLCLDTHWILRGGQDPLALLREAGSRTVSLHLRNSKNNIWTEDFGDGDLDYRQVARFLRQSGFSGYLVVELAYEKETGITRPLEEDLKRSRAYAEKVFF